MSAKWRFNPFEAFFHAMIAIGLWEMPGIWWAKVLIFLGITLAINVSRR